MAEPFTTTMLGDDVPLDGDPAVGTGLDRALAATRSRWDGLEDLPVDEPPLDDGTEVLPDPAATTPEPPVALELPPDAPPGLVDPQIAALQSQVQFLMQQLQTREPAPVITTPVTSPLVASEEGLERATQRFERAFGSIEDMEAGTPEYAKARAREFAQTVVQAVLEDILPQERVQEHIRTVAQPVAQQVYSQYDSAKTQQLEGQQVIDLAVRTAREKGYDVHPPGSPQHLESQDSVIFWGIGGQISRDGRSAADDIAATLAFMPPKAPAAVPPAPVASLPRPQPMGRQSAGVPTPGGGAPANDTYQPQTISGILNAQRGIQRVG